MGVALKETLFVIISWFHAFSHLLLSSAKRTITVKKPSPFQKSQKTASLFHMVGVKSLGIKPRTKVGDIATYLIGDYLYYVMMPYGSVKKRTE